MPRNTGGKENIDMKDLRIVLRKGFATFSSSCCPALGKPAYIAMSVDGNKIAFEPSEEGIRFYRDCKERQLVLHAGKEVVKAFEKLSNQQFDKKTGTPFTGRMADGKLVFEF